MNTIHTIPEVDIVYLTRSLICDRHHVLQVLIILWGISSYKGRLKRLALLRPYLETIESKNKERIEPNNIAKPNQN